MYVFRKDTRPYLVWKGISHLSHALHSLAEGPGLLYQPLGSRIVLLQPLEKGPSIAQHFLQSAGHLLEAANSYMSRKQATFHCQRDIQRCIIGWLHKNST
ncbi:hypothetical protein INR49_022152 [Caranx melampygus]|nr:hypothetical protein INR49_022152 [Caranx melampygus]